MDYRDMSYPQLRDLIEESCQIIDNHRYRLKVLRDEMERRRIADTEDTTTWIMSRKVGNA